MVSTSLLFYTSRYLYYIDFSTWDLSNVYDASNMMGFTFLLTYSENDAPMNQEGAVSNRTGLGFTTNW